MSCLTKPHSLAFCKKKRKKQTKTLTVKRVDQKTKQFDASPEGKSTPVNNEPNVSSQSITVCQAEILQIAIPRLRCTEFKAGIRW